MVKIVILNVADLVHFKKWLPENDDVCHKFINDLQEEIKVSVTEVGKEYKF